MKEPLIEVKGLSVTFPGNRRSANRGGSGVTAVEDVSFSIMQGETLGLVGESGCGKTTLGRALARLLPVAARGEVYFMGRPLHNMGEREFRRQRREIQMIFQDPFSSLNPRLTIGQMLAEVIRVHRIASGKAIRMRAEELLETVGLDRAYYDRYPHEFSGGQRQRVGIARALALNPRLVICDEPVSALDVSIQSQIINLLRDLQKELGLTYLFIAHDLSVVEHISDRVAVMYLGNIVELAGSDELYRSPGHPYTKALMSAIPVPEPGCRRERIILKGDVPSPLDRPSGCSFHPRCPEAEPRCAAEVPLLSPIASDPSHAVSCLLVE
ncbi:ABC transporter ATP-binding protein [Prosthecochloris vibrioformis]|uniref:ATP-binding cassette domain-containing protein n=1 Tax=Prosthecochloris vibrioformis TaxID=1098 RepID=A0A5C4S114_PROVB|nr:oligopeptide/dipeptide ABC transporter ATP-binding protein [Prosthecochloris vibrioformis]TNJ37196.1 ATP-binding cassette domain-containing protein [Prosthecochloris vibrioformis]